MNTKGWMASLVPLPIIIDTPGIYKTRCGELVTVCRASEKHAFACHGFYGTDTKLMTLECWHKSGRLYFGQLSDNDIVEKVSHEVHPVSE